MYQPASSEIEVIRTPPEERLENLPLLDKRSVASSLLKMELLELEPEMVRRVAKCVPPSFCLFVAYRFYIVYRQIPLDPVDP